MSGPSLAPYILRRPWLKKWMMPFANWYANASGYRKLGQHSRRLRSCDCDKAADRVQVSKQMI